MGAIWRVAVIALLVFVTTPAYSQTPPPPPAALTVKCIVTSLVSGGCSAGSDTLAGFTIPTPIPTLVSAQGYNVPGDGGGGDFYLFSSTSACSSSTLDGGTAFSNGSTCYHRRFTGTVYMAWFGVQNSTGSNLYDVAAACPGPTSCFDRAFQAAQDQAIGNGNNSTVSTGGMYLYSTAGVVPLQNQTLTCNAPYTGQPSRNYGPGNGVVGAILLGHPASIHLLNANTNFHNCVVLTNGSTASPIHFNLKTDCGSSDAQVQQCLLKDVQAMTANGDVGILCGIGAENVTIHQVTIAGFDTGIAAHGCSRFTIQNARIDADVGIYLQNNKTPTMISDVAINPMIGSELGNSFTQQAYTVSNITSSTGLNGGACIISVTTTTNIKVGDWVSLAGDKVPNDEGPLSCYGTFVVSNVSMSTLDITLQGPIYGDGSGPFTTMPRTGTWPANSSIITVSDPSSIQAGQCVTSSNHDVFPTSYKCTTSNGTISNSVMVKDVSYYSGKIVIDQPTQDFPTMAETFSFTNYGAYPTAVCSVPMPPATCSRLYLYGTPRYTAGDSLGGAAAAHVATCLLGGGPGDTSPLGLIANNIYCFGHRVQYNFNSVGPAICTGCAFDSQAELFDINQIGVRYGHGTDPLVLNGVAAGSGCGGSLGCIGAVHYLTLTHSIPPTQAGETTTLS